VINLQNVPAGSSVTLCNMLGQHILHTITTSTQDVLQLQQLPVGTYLLQISAKDGNTVYKKISKV
jgi:Secretion system C-terminal sorting domain